MVTPQLSQQIFDMMREGDKHTQPPTEAEIQVVLKSIRIVRGEVKNVPLKKRVLEALRLHNEVGLEPRLQPTFLEAGGTPVLIDLIVSDWPKDSNFAASKSALDEVVILTEDMDRQLVALSGASGQKHLALVGKAAPLKRSLRRAALDALAEASNYPIIVNSIQRDGHIFNVNWLPVKLPQLLRHFKYGMDNEQQRAHADQVHNIAERLLYLAGNCCTNSSVVWLLNQHCSLDVVKTFRDEWQRKYEPLASEQSSSSHRRARELRQQQRQRQRQYRSSMPSSMADMYQMVLEMCEEQAESDMMSYSFGRYLSHSLQVASKEQKMKLIEAGTLAKVRVVNDHSTPHQKPGMALENVIERLEETWEEHSRQYSQQASLANKPIAAKAEALRLAGNTEFKAGQLQAALQQYSQAVQQLPSDALLYNNISLVQLKLGRVEQAYDAAWAAIGHAPDNAKAWVRFGEACRAAGRWQLAQLAYATAEQELGLQDPAVLEHRQACCSHLSRVWRMNNIPAPWQFDDVARWMQLPPKPLAGPAVAAWEDHLAAETERLGRTSRRLAVNLKGSLLIGRAWRAAASGQLRRLPQKGNVIRVTWLQTDVRGATSRKPWYAILLLPEKAGSSPYMIGRVQGQPSAKDLLVTIASHCMEPSTGGAPVRPKQLLLAYRTRALFAELQDTLTKQWGIPVMLETELEAQRRVQEPASNEQHYLGLCGLVAAGADEASLPVTTARLLLEGDMQDAGNDHQQGWEPARRSAEDAVAEAAAGLSLADESSSNGAPGAGVTAYAAAAEQQAVGLGSCSRLSGGDDDAVWVSLLGAVRGGAAGGKEVDQLAKRVALLHGAVLAMDEFVARGEPVIG